MKVKELSKKLYEFNPNAEIEIVVGDKGYSDIRLAWGL